MTEENTETIDISFAERKKLRVLVVEPNVEERERFKTMLSALGYGDITEADEYLAALKKLTDRTFTHAIFSVHAHSMPHPEFLMELIRQEPNIVAIAAAKDLEIDDLFELLVIGARGYLMLPFDVDTIQNSIIWATKGKPIPDSILKAEDRNKSLVAMMASDLDRIADVMRQAKGAPSLAREIPELMSSFQRSATLAKKFKKGSEDDLLKSIEDFCIEKSLKPASTRLGKARQKIAERRQKLAGKHPEPDAAG